MDGVELPSTGILNRIHLGRQLKTVLWKNWVLTMRNKKDLLREFVFPIVMLIILVFIRAALPNVVVPATFDQPAVAITPNTTLSGKIWFAPCVATQPTDPVLQFLQRFAKRYPKTQAECVPCNSRADCATDSLYYQSIDSRISRLHDPSIRAVVFDSPEALAAGSTLAIHYKLRQDASLMPSVGQSNVYNTWRYGPSNVPKEYIHGFLPLQVAVEQLMAENHNSKYTPLPLFVKEFPFPEFKLDIAAPVMAGIVPIYLLLIFSVQVRVTIQRILEEKEKRIKEGMKMMGLSDEVHIVSWLITCTVKSALVIVGIIIVCKAGLVFQFSDWSLMLVFFLLFGFVCTAYVFVITTFVSRAHTGGAIGMLGYLILYLPSWIVQSPAVGVWVKYFVSLLAPTAFALGTLVFNAAEGTRQGVQWDTLYDVPPEVGVSMGGVLGMLFLDAVLYTVLAWYLDKVVPNSFGPHKAPLFCCRPSYWRAPPKLQRQVSEDDGILPEHFEPVPPNVASRPGVRIMNLCKTFDTHSGAVKAVDNLSLTLYEGQITCLLGHNGAGKTTTISMLTGIYTPTGGEALVYGRSVREDMQGVRELTSVCPQHDILFDELTVKEHLLLFGGIKGIPPQPLSHQVQQLIVEVGLQDKSNAQAKTLSGGQKRRLSVAISLMGDPKVVFLDEPTSGLDPQSRRAMWELIERRKAGRVIVLTTHFMDEADILGDRIAIMSRGALAVVGSSLFLKSRLGIGYHLRLLGTTATNIRAIEEAVFAHVPNAVIDNEVEEPTSPIAGGSPDDLREISCILPLAQATAFGLLFNDLDAKMEQLHLHGYSMSVTSLEEVFLQLAEREAQASGAAPPDSAEVEMVDVSDASPERSRSPGASFRWPAEPVSLPPANKPAEEPNHFMQFRAMALRHLRHLSRDRRAFAVQMLMPSIMVGLSFLFRYIANINPATSLQDTVMSSSQFTTDVTVPASLLWATLPAASAVTPQRLMAAIASLAGAPSVNRVPAPSSVSFAALDKYLMEKDTTAGLYAFGAAGNVTVMFNSSYANGLPILLNLLSNAAVVVSDPGTAAPAMSLTYSPMPSASGATFFELLSSALIGFYIAIGFGALPDVMAVLIVKERECKARQMQSVMGLSSVAYWSAKWLWDCTQFLVPWITSVILVAIFGGSSFGGGNLAAIALLLLVYGLAIPGPAYAISFAFSNPASAHAFTMLTFNGLTVFTFFIVFIVQAVPGVPDSVPIALTHIFNVYPNFALAKGFADTGLLGATKCVFDVCTQQSAFEWSLAGGKIVYLVLSIPLWFCIVLGLDRWKLSARPGAAPSASSVDTTGEDEDVKAERRRVDAGDADSAKIVVRHLRKEFPNADGGVNVAVKDLTLACPAGECFGLLGPNGAGKTTSLSMLTGDFGPTAGTAILGGHDLYQHRDLVYQHMGYCPQFDALFETLTTEECLEFYASIKGLPPADIKELINVACKKMLLEPYRRTLCRNLSGGNKRKLSLCIAFIGAPETVFLDEPSTGVDPLARRGMWNLVSHARAGRTIVVTTHLMEEADALCSRIGILVNGSLACLGSPAHLKQQYGCGYQVEVRTEDDHKVAGLKQLMLDICPEAVLLENHSGHFRYQLAPSLKLSRVFSMIEENKTRLAITDYAVSQTTLEQVFLNFARGQSVSV